MGWVNYSPNRGIGYTEFFQDDDFVRYFIDLKQHKICYIIKELDDDEKQKSKNRYKFIKMNYNFVILKIPKFEVVEFNSNLELLKLIIKNESCNLTYQRHIKLIKLLKWKEKK